MSRRFPARAIAASLSVISVGLLAQQSEQRPPSQPIRSGVELVTVDVTVLDRNGAPLTSLALPDFSVAVDGRPRKLVSARLTSVVDGPATREAPKAGASTESGATRRFVIAVDRDHIRAGLGQQFLNAAANFVDTLPTSDRVAVWSIPASTNRLQFTTDREHVKREIRELVGTYRPPLMRWNVAPDGASDIDDGRREVLAAVVARECYKQKDECPTEVESEARQIALDSRDRARVTLDDLAGLVAALGGLSGPTDVVLLTEGPLGRQHEFPLVNRVVDAAATSRVTIHAIQVALPPAQASSEQMRPVAQWVDQSRSSAYLLAGATGGLAITPSDGEVGFRQLRRQLSAGYLLAFEAEPGDRDGRVHQIDVRVAQTGWGGLVRARKSFRISAGVNSREPEARDPTAADAEANPGSEFETSRAPSLPASSSAVALKDAKGLAQVLGEYADRFEREYSAVVAEERYVQIIHPWRGMPKGPEAEPTLTWVDSGAPRPGKPIVMRRQLLSDVLLVQVPGLDWMAYRDVAAVDGSAVRDREERMRKLLLSPSTDSLSQLRRIGDESARYNLGAVRRTMNLPNVALSFMRPAMQSRFKFETGKDDRLGNRLVRVVAYRERSHTTLVRTSEGRSVPAYGRVWIDVETGAVVRTELRLDRAELRSLVRVEFDDVLGSGVLLPTAMWEWYEGVDIPGGITEERSTAQGLATYTAYKRFGVSTTEGVKR